ncbi:lysosome-associated membrane glycoprotein 2-like isoform X2 [Megalops cyprinoides]|uniref:lysosome-associated membrane glycoprotein 2-like isoform X2 n=1 Tax=Megalops cyprinoides TaxID=118141 RepID=UPI001863F8C4|nr:lysosome-associated membrane glycoprotein 2-like isoform X2 [Megalops cyprinoides]
MRHYAFLALFLLLGSETVCANVTTVPTAAPTTVTTVPTPAPTTVTTVPTAAPTTVTTVPTPAPTTVTAAPTPAPTNATAPLTTAAANATTAPPPEPTTEATNATTAPPPEPTTEATNATTAPPPEPTTEVTNGTTVPPPEPTTEVANATTAPSPATSAAPTAAPTPAPTPLPQPSVGSYSVRSKENSTACLMATMGLQISYKEGAVLKSINLDPNNTVAAGSCGVNGSDASLLLTFDKGSVAFVFSEEGRKFRLHVVNATIIPSANGTAFSASNTNLSLWEASVGTSYMCRKDQTYNITDALALHTLGLQVQPFGVQNNSFSTAEECFLDSDLTFLVPIAVGVALAFLIILVLISYLIGRRKSRTGYQSV